MLALKCLDIDYTFYASNTSMGQVYEVKKKRYIYQNDKQLQIIVKDVNILINYRRTSRLQA